MSEQFDVSVVVSTYNRCELLPATLESLLAQETGGVSYEIIIVDNNSKDATREVVESYIARGGAKSSDLRYVFEGKQGVSHGRNAGIANARAPVVAFTDDDIQVARDWVASIKRAFDEHQEVDFIGGKVLPKWEREPPRWLTREHWSPLALIDYGDAPFYVNAERQICLITANAAFRRSALEDVGRFSPDFQRVKHNTCSTEDHELLLRLWRAGRQGMYVPSLVVETEVPLQRMTKQFHRTWHGGHGHLLSLMRLDEMERTSKGSLFDVPAPLYRQALSNVAAWCGKRLRGRRDEAFLHEARLYFFAGFFRARRREFLAGAHHGALTEVARFVRALAQGGEAEGMEAKPDGNR